MDNNLKNDQNSSDTRSFSSAGLYEPKNTDDSPFRQPNPGTNDNLDTVQFAPPPKQPQPAPKSNSAAPPLKFNGVHEQQPAVNAPLPQPQFSAAPNGQMPQQQFSASPNGQSPQQPNTVPNRPIPQPQFNAAPNAPVPPPMYNQQVPPQYNPVPNGQSPQQKPPKKKKKHTVGILVTIIILLILLIGGLLLFLVLNNGDKDDDDSSSRRTTSKTTTSSKTTTQKTTDDDEEEETTETTAETSEDESDSDKDIVEVPDLTNMLYSRAVLKMRDLDVKVEAEYEYSESFDKDHIISQSIPEGTKVKKGEETIILTVSKGENPVRKIKTPDVVSMNYITAQEQLEALSFSVVIEQEYSDTVSKNVVISQSISPDLEVDMNTRITLVVSKGKQSTPPVVVAPTEQVWYGKVVTQETALNVRSSPSISGSLIGMVAKGATVEIIEQTGNWYKIKYKNGYGYVSADYIQLT